MILSHLAKKITAISGIPHPESLISEFTIYFIYLGSGNLACIMIRTHNEDMEYDCVRAVTGFISRLCSFTQSVCAGGEDVPCEVTSEVRLTN